MSRLALSTDGTDNDFEINFYNYHAIDVLEIVLKGTGITEFMPDKIILLEEKIKDLCSWCSKNLRTSKQ